MREYLHALDANAAAEALPPPDDNMPPGNPAAEPKFTSLTDPAATWTNKGQMKVMFAYGCNYLIDLRAAAIIVDVQATPARWSAEVAVTKTMLARTETCFGLKPTRLAADAAYGSGLMIGWLTRRLRPRGLTGASDEFLLAATVQNLKKLVRNVAVGPPEVIARTT